MKTRKFTIYDLRFTRRSRESSGSEQQEQPFNGPRPLPSTLGHPSRKSQIVNRKSQEGIALVITLILLSVTLVMAIAFLSISRRERNSVSTTEDTAAAKFAADAALAKAEARIVSQILSTTNPYVFSLVVSTNYINLNGFTNTGAAVASLENVNYNNYAPGQGSSGPLLAADLEQNIANLYYDPRPPVYYSNDFRFYLDLNRNGMYDTNGWVTNLNNGGQGLGTVSFEVGDPEWIGILAHPDQPHSANNPFIARYCFIAVPANSLDLNTIHNQALSPFNSGNGLNLTADNYFRNQGVGTWEINLAAFLTDLNTNIWDPQNGGSEYEYRRPSGFPNTGVAFNDAFVLLTNRYAGFYASEKSALNLFGPNGLTALQLNGIDTYTRGPVQAAFDWNYAPQSLFSYYWVGAENTNNFFTLDDLFNPNATAGFGIHLQNAGVNMADANGIGGTVVPTYDRYTFYRMLGQLGTDTQPTSGKIDLNYSNAVVNCDANGILTNFAIVPNMETNFQSWQPQAFFTAAANQLLQAYTAEWFQESPSNYLQTYYGIYYTNYNNISGYGLTNMPYLGILNQIPSFGITNIPVYVNGNFVYTPAVNRLLQLAANIYDASTNGTVAGLAVSNYPSVFRPIFWVTNELDRFGIRQTDVYIKGYQYVREPLDAANSIFNGNIFAPPVEVTDPGILGIGGTGGGIINSNIWGVPWIIGAKKGFPNFNGTEVDNMFFVERLLQYNRNNADPAAENSTFPFGRIYSTNQMYIVGVSNAFVMDNWNSYASSYANPVIIAGRDNFSFGLSNDATGYQPVTTYFTTNYGTPITAWPGTSPTLASSWVLPLGTNVCIPQNLSSAPNSPASTNSTYVYFDGSAFGATNISGVTYTAPCFIPTSGNPENFLNKGLPPLPHLVMQTTNRLQAWMLDNQNANAPYILDYVQLGGMNGSLDVNQAISDGNNSGTWSTNIMMQGSSYGINQQFLTSSWGGSVPGADTDDPWSVGGSRTAVPGANGDTSQPAEQAYFSAFFSPINNAAYYGVKSGYITNISLSVQAPYSAMRLIVQRYVYQANDPLVHFMTPDLYDFLDSTNGRYTLSLPAPTPLYIAPGQGSDRYMPWSVGGNLGSATLNSIPADDNPYNLSYRDPLVTASDYWDFPTNKYPTVGWLGRVHRGTPWQTVYLKSPDILLQTKALGSQTLNQGVPTWQVWTGNLFNSYDAVNTAPDQDRLLFDLFTATPDDDATRGQLSVNIGADDPTNMLAGLASWSALLSGIGVFTNNTPDQTIGFNTPNPPAFSVWTGQPLGANTNGALWQIVTGINSSRTNYGAFPAIGGLQGVFEHVGDILRVPQLSVASPFLNNDAPQQPVAINDEMYEWLPQQILGLVTASGTPQNPPRYVIYCYGQTLKPAANGFVTGVGALSGLCTNYQVQAESAARVVIRVVNTPTPANPNAAPHIVVEQYNALPPD